MSHGVEQYDGRNCLFDCPEGPCHCRDAVRTDKEVHTSGYLRVVRDRGMRTAGVAGRELDLDDDTPLSGGVCDSGRPEGCESCQ